MQNPVLGIPNGAICCKKRPNTISGRVPSNRSQCVCRQDSCCVCRQDICCVSRQDICCVIVSAGISQDIPQAFPTQRRPLRGRPCGGNVGGMSLEMSADTMTQQMLCRRKKPQASFEAGCLRSGIILNYPGIFRNSLGIIRNHPRLGTGKNAVSPAGNLYFGTWNYPGIIFRITVTGWCQECRSGPPSTRAGGQDDGS